MGSEKKKEVAPQRNHFCRSYEECLEKAAMENLPELPCHGCRYEHDQDGRKRFRDYIDGSWALLGALFYPEDKEPEVTGAKDLLQKYCSSPSDDKSEGHSHSVRAVGSDEK